MTVSPSSVTAVRYGSTTRCSAAATVPMPSSRVALSPSRATAALADKLKAVDAYVAPVELTPQRVLPGNLRERIRFNGPTVALPGER